MYKISIEVDFSTKKAAILLKQARCKHILTGAFTSL